MNEIEKSIAYLKASVKYAEENSTNLNDAKEVKNIISTAIQALEKHIPKKPEYTTDYDNYASFYICPNCKVIVIETENYCSGCRPLGEEGCGQKLDWGVDDEN